MVSFLYLFIKYLPSIYYVPEHSISVGDTTVKHLLLYYTFSQLIYSAMKDFPQIYKMKYKLLQYVIQNL